MNIDISQLPVEQRQQVLNMAEDKGLTMGSLVIQALRLYADHDRKLENGEICTWSGDAQRARDFVGRPLYRYKIGNCLRGYFEGNFENIDDAWEILSRRFLMSYPVEGEGGRFVQMLVTELNHYGIEQSIVCKCGDTAVDCMATDAEVLERTKRAP